MNSTETIHDMLSKYFTRRRVQGFEGGIAKNARSWLRKRVIAFLHSEYIAKLPEEPKSIEQ